MAWLVFRRRPPCVEDSCECTEWAVSNRRQEWSSGISVRGGGANNSPSKPTMLWNITQGLEGSVHNDLIHVAQNRVQWRGLGNAVMNLGIHRMRIIFMTSWATLSSSTTLLHAVNNSLRLQLSNIADMTLCTECVYECYHLFIVDLLIYLFIIFVCWFLTLETPIWAPPLFSKV
jgi:hypothetical protein